MIERLDFNELPYRAIEGAVHLNRYMLARNICKDKVILDAACGEGYGSFLLAQWEAERVVGVDISTEAINSAQKVFKDEKIQFIANDVEHLTMFEANTFDVVISFETIEHLTNPTAFLQEIKRLVKPEGIIIISCPNDYCYYPGADEKNPYHVRKYTIDDFKELTTGVLGMYSQFIIGSPAAGFINFCEKAEETSVAENQVKMLKYEPCDTFRLPQDHIVDGRNCSYFIGVWGIPAENFTENAVVYPNGLNQYSYYEKADIVDAFNNEPSELNRYKLIIKELAGELRRCQDGVASEEEQVKFQKTYYEMVRDFEREAAKYRVQNLEMEREANKYRTLYEAVSAEYKLLKQNFAAEAEAQTRLEEIYGSNGYRMLLKWYRFKDLLLTLFKKS